MMEREVPDVQKGRKQGLRIAELPFNLGTDDLKVIPVNLNLGDSAWGCILTRSLDAPLEEAVIWFTHVSPKYERRQFYNLKGVLNKYWKILKEQEARICPA
ncbi:MAG: hypothetical protein LBF32_02640 [Streptococcaceae bacterium]|jgi:hypothetical protein|nr:hypothetical protein [Streptococcaceae bacterium]